MNNSKLLGWLLIAASVFAVLNTWTGFASLNYDFNLYRDIRGYMDVLYQNSFLGYTSLVLDAFGYYLIPPLFMVWYSFKKRHGYILFPPSVIFGVSGLIGVVLGIYSLSQAITIYATDPGTAASYLHSYQSLILDYWWGIWGNISGFFMLVTFLFLFTPVKNDFLGLAVKYSIVVTAISLIISHLFDIPPAAYETLTMLYFLLWPINLFLLGLLSHQDRISPTFNR